jgi:putative transposase
MQRLHSQTVQEVIERLDLAYRRFFDKVSKRPPKFKRAADFSSIVFKQGGFKLKGNRFTINKIGTTFKFSLSRPLRGDVKRLSVKKSPLGDYYLCVVTDAEARRYGKTHDGASVGIDFGLKTYMTLSDGLVVDNPQFLKANLSKLRSASRRVSRCQRDSNSRKSAVKALNRCHEKVVNARTDWQWKTAHQVCRAYDNIFVEDLNLTGMCRRWGRKMHDLAHGRFVEILEVVAAKYGCTVHKIDRFYPSSKMCECGYKNDELRLSDREWVCPQCGRVHDRDLNAARNILRRGIDELASTSKSADREVIGRCV